MDGTKIGKLFSDRVDHCCPAIEKSRLALLFQLEILLPASLDPTNLNPQTRWPLAKRSISRPRFFSFLPSRRAGNFFRLASFITYHSPTPRRQAFFPQTKPDPPCHRSLFSTDRFETFVAGSFCRRYLLLRTASFCASSPISRVSTIFTSFPTCSPPHKSLPRRLSSSVFEVFKSFDSLPGFLKCLSNS